MEAPEVIIGIDLGTTFSVIAVAGKVSLVDGYPAEGRYLDCDVTIIPTPHYEYTIPSVVLERPSAPGTFIVGMESKQAAEEGESPIMWSKRKIGTTERLPLRQGSMTAKDAAREILKYLKSVAEQALGRPVRRAVVTHPAYFDRNQVEETREAAVQAGFDMAQVEQTLMEPVAAAYAYTRQDPKDPLRIMVYDLGGGTFDVTILERRGGAITCKAFDGNQLLGGYNFDRKLAQWILDKLAAKGRQVPYDENNAEDRGRRARLLTFAESLKIRLADMGRKKKVPIDVQPDFLVDTEGRKIKVMEKISQEEFVGLIRQELDETIACCNRCLAKANLQPQDLDYVLLVGGSTHGPWIDELVRTTFGVEPQRFEPDLCVAAGAAIQAQSLPTVDRQGDLELVMDVPPRSSLPAIDITGRLNAPDPERKGLQMMLRTPQGRSVGPQPLSEGGTFLFRNVALLEEGPTVFDLQVLEALGTSGVPRLQKTLTVTYAPESSDVVGHHTSLPKPLYIKTVSGIHLFAEEGDPLPSEELLIDLKRVFSGPTETIDILQGGEPAGQILIENIPDQAGEGAKIKLKVRVTEKNEIKGVAQVFAVRGGALACQGEVFVKFPPTPIPELRDLEDQFRRLEDDRAQKITLSDDPEQRTLMVGKGARLANEIREKFREQAPDRQEIMAKLRELNAVVNPPESDMDPPRAHFESLLISCRELLADKKDDPQVQMFMHMVEKCDREGHDALLKKDERKWGTINESLAALYRKLQPAEVEERRRGSEQILPETVILKDQALFAIGQMRESLNGARDSLGAADLPKYEAVFKSRVEAVAKTIDVMEQKVKDIKDETKNTEALGKIQVALRDRATVERKIRDLQSGATVDRA
jgi:hypothetical protein